MPLHARDRIGLEELLDRLHMMSAAPPTVRLAVRLLEGLVDGSHQMTDAEIEQHLAEAGRLLAAVAGAPRWAN